MNLSSIVVQVNPDFEKDIAEKLKQSEICEVHICSGDGRIIVTVEGKNIEEEIKMLKEIQKFEHVIAADMVYSYSEEELDGIRSDIEHADSTPKWLNNPNLKAKDINYQGDLKKKI